MEPENVEFSCGIVLPAGGCGLRMKSPIPKQYKYVADKPLIFYTLYAFQRLFWVEFIIVVVGECYFEWMKNFSKEHGFDKVTVVIGGETRHRSIFNGIKEIPKVCKKPDIILIHDAVRIVAEEELVRKIAVSAKTYGAAGVTRPLISTVIAVDSNQFLAESLDRSLYRASEMPQGFRYSVIKQAYEQCTEEDFLYGTECLLLAMKYSNVKAHIIEGNSSLWKVTLKKDLYTAEGVLKEKYSMTQLVNLPENSDLSSIFQEEFSKKNLQFSTVQMISATLPSSPNSLFQNVIEFINVTNIQTRIPQSLAEYKDQNIRKPMKTAHVYVILLDNREDVVTNLNSVHMLFEEHLGKVKNIVICNVILSVKNKLEEKLVQMCTDIIWNRNESFHGQIFTIY